MPITASNLMKHDFYEQAYDEQNAHELLVNTDFMRELGALMPQNDITASFLTDAWKECVSYTYGDEMIFDEIPSDIANYYHHTQNAVKA
ncbi:hypothetical protein EP56_01835 [Listeriaceae bacterium FSL A5-0209]|nr:hypothetical protein EP56_01835 [Listeriaceae bacterium FSL A5-0209]